MLCFLAIGVGCGGSPPPPPEPPPPELPALGSLRTLIPPDASVVVLANPAALLASEATGQVVRAIFPDEQLDRFRIRTGVDPRELDELVIGVHPEGSVAIARGPIDAVFAVREAGDRMAPLESSVDGPRPRRVGFLGARRTDLAALADDVVLWVEGTPQLAAAVLAAAAVPAGERVHALADLGPALEAHSDSPLVVVAPRPLGLPFDTGIGLLLSREESLLVVLRAGDESLHLQAELRGEFPDESHSNFRTFLESIAESELGAVLGIPEALPTLRIEAGSDRVGLAASISPAALVSGLRLLLVAEMRELLDGPESSEGTR